MDENIGYIVLWRSIRDTEMWREIPFCKGKLWIWLLIEATHKNAVLKRQLKIGQINHALRFISKALEWYDPIKCKSIKPAPETIKKVLCELEQEGRITIESTPRMAGRGRTLLTICNYARYQYKTPEVTYQLKEAIGTNSHWY